MWLSTVAGVLGIYDAVMWSAAGGQTRTSYDFIVPRGMPSDTEPRTKRPYRLLRIPGTISFRHLSPTSVNFR